MTTPAKSIVLKGVKFDIIGRTNGHEWIKYHTLVCCCLCGTVRNATDTNRQCNGPARIELREDGHARPI